MKNKNNILVSGTLAYDRIMDFPGRFRDHILPEKIHILNISFSINGIKESFGGTAGNIAYNLSLLEEDPKILTITGDDFSPYEAWLKKNRIDISQVKKIKGEKTASAYIITDQDDNQINGFYNGPEDRDYIKIAKKQKGAKIAIVAPEYKKRMLGLIKIYKELKIPYIFDPGQQITNFSQIDLKSAVNGSKIVIGNDYEIYLILDKLKISQKKLEAMTEALIITKGAKGSEVYNQNKKIIIPPARPKNTNDPTGAGDAYRAGLIKGLMENWDWNKIGRLAGLVSVYTVEKYGTQTHRFSLKDLAMRYKKNFGDKLF